MKTTRPLLWALLLASSQSLPAAPAGQTEHGLSRQVITLVNSARRQAGCGDLQISSELMEVARRQSADMAEHHYLRHEDSRGMPLAERLEAVGYPYQMAAENLAAGRMGANEAVRGWLDSPAHRTHMLDCRLQETGVAIAVSNDDYGLYWTQVFGSTP